MKILFTGGGTGGHFYPIIAVAKEIQKVTKQEKLLAPELYYMAPTPYDARELFENNILYQKIAAGKMRRYFSIRNFFDLFKTGWGVLSAVFAVFSLYPDVIFGKGGYGSFPVLLAAKLFRIPVIIHESDVKPGRVNTWAGKFAYRVMISHPETAAYFKKEKVVYSGCPIREEIANPIAEGAHDFLKLELGVPVILILGGSQGSQIINGSVMDALPNLLPNYQIIHQVGEANFEEIRNTTDVVLKDNPKKSRYHIFAYLNSLALRMSAGVASIVISRAGSTIFEIALWGLPSIIVPIDPGVSHDQTQNAFSYAEIKPEMLVALICREMKWTYKEFQDQPAWFIDIILEMLQAERVV
jgi:UDP-N-acetylglucosamine--N-acetylmuramyl-(pentapeptide) pyrophosphoryl-undecaprenol N-acetylglucosamine transferase